MAFVVVCVTIRCKVTYCRPRSNFEMFVSLSAGNYNDTMGTWYVLYSRFFLPLLRKTFKIYKCRMSREL